MIDFKKREVRRFFVPSLTISYQYFLPIVKYITHLLQIRLWECSPFVTGAAHVGTTHFLLLSIADGAKIPPAANITARLFFSPKAPIVTTDRISRKANGVTLVRTVSDPFDAGSV